MISSSLKVVTDRAPISQKTVTTGMHPEARHQVRDKASRSRSPSVRAPVIQKIANVSNLREVNMVRTHLASHVLRAQNRQAVQAEVVETVATRLAPSVDAVRARSIKTLTPSSKETPNTAIQRGKTGAMVHQEKIRLTATKMQVATKVTRITRTSNKMMDTHSASPHSTRAAEAVVEGTTRAEEEEVGEGTTREAEEVALAKTEVVGVVALAKIEVVGVVMTREEEEEAEVATTKVVEVAAEAASNQGVVAALMVAAEEVEAATNQGVVEALMEEEVVAASMEEGVVAAAATTRVEEVVEATIRVEEEVGEDTTKEVGVVTVATMAASCREAVAASMEEEVAVAMTREVEVAEAMTREVEVAEAMTRVDTAEAATTNTEITSRTKDTLAMGVRMRLNRRESSVSVPFSTMTILERTPKQQVSLKVLTFRDKGRRRMFDAGIGQTVKMKQLASSTILLSLASSSPNAPAVIRAFIFTLTLPASLRTRALA